MNLRIAAGSPRGPVFPVARDLASYYTEALSKVTVSVEPTLGLQSNLGAVEHGQVDLAYTQADLAYLAYRGGTEEQQPPHHNLRGVAVLWVNTFQVVVRRGSPIRTMQDLNGRKIAIAGSGTAAEVFARLVLQGYDLVYTAQPTPIALESAAGELSPNVERADAAIRLSGMPVSLPTRNPFADAEPFEGVRVVPVTGPAAMNLRANYPFIKPTIVRQGTYEGQKHDVESIGIDTILICRRDLPDDLVYELTKALFDSVPSLSKRHAFAGAIDPDEAPSTPIPLHPGAARYYREREILR